MRRPAGRRLKGPNLMERAKGSMDLHLDFFQLESYVPKLLSVYLKIGAQHSSLSHLKCAPKVKPNHPSSRTARLFAVGHVPRPIFAAALFYLHGLWASTPVPHRPVQWPRFLFTFHFARSSIFVFLYATSFLTAGSFHLRLSLYSL